MRRRNVLIGLGAAATGGAAVFGSGAFTQLEASRSFDIHVAGDGSAHLQFLNPDNSTDWDTAGIDWSTTTAIGHTDDAITVDLQQMGDGGGINVDSYATLGELEQIGDVNSDVITAAFVLNSEHDDELTLTADLTGTSNIVEDRFDIAVMEFGTTGSSQLISGGEFILDNTTEYGQ